VSGLQIRARDHWLDVPPVPDGFVVNLGDSMAQWTNDQWRSTLHRVVAHGDADGRSPARQSFAFFHMANWDAIIECLPTCLAPGAVPRHAPVLAGPWLMSKFTSTVAVRTND
jgi:isopenicillin N synthase-like dioxygenase